MSLFVPRHKPHPSDQRPRVKGRLLGGAGDDGPRVDWISTVAVLIALAVVVAAVIVALVGGC